MKHEVIIMPEAERELDEAYLWLLGETPQHAPLWYNGVVGALRSLEDNPTRCPVITQQEVPETIRQLLYGNKRYAYRILFTVQDDRVLVLHIFNAARNRF